MIDRGPRHRGRVDLASADWQRNEYGVDVLLLSEDPVSGAMTMALRTPAGLDYPEREHFYDCDEDLFQFEGEFHHDEERPFHAGDYIYRPPGTVYGHSQGSTGGIIIAALNNRPRRFHFDDHPPWTGEYLIDAAWHRRAVQPFVVRHGSIAWRDAGLGRVIEMQALRGTPGERSALYGARAHSPWGADAACLLRIPRGYDGPSPAWPDAALEVLVTAGHAELNGESWYRGCYGFDVFTGRCAVTEALELYARVFLPPDIESAD